MLWRLQYFVIDYEFEPYMNHVADDYFLGIY